LVAACVTTKDELVWVEFIRRFHPLISTVALRTARQWGEPVPSLLDDLIQETYLKLCSDDCRLLKNFRSRYSSAIFGFLKVVTANVVHDHFKASRAAKRGAGVFFDSLDDHEGNENYITNDSSHSASSTVEQTIKPFFSTKLIAVLSEVLRPPNYRAVVGSFGCITAAD
jgi:RNA polymerase sigma-70 factor (ECF subfamily)